MFLSMCDIFRPYMCHMMVHCLTCIVLNATHGSYWFYLETYFVSVLDNSCQNSSILNFTHSIGVLCLVLHTYFLWNSGSNLMIGWTIVPSKIICRYSSKSACKNAHGMSVTAMYRHPYASIVHVIIIASRYTVVELVYAFMVLFAVIARLYLLWP